MTELEELTKRISHLPIEDFAKLRDWFQQQDDDQWDQQISTDYKQGKFDELIKKARMEMAQGEVREL